MTVQENLKRLMAEHPHEFALFTAFVLDEPIRDRNLNVRVGLEHWSIRELMDAHADRSSQKLADAIEAEIAARLARRAGEPA